MNTLNGFNTMRPSAPRQRNGLSMSVAFLGVLFAGYVAFQANDVLFGPSLELESPSDGVSMRGGVVVSGKTDPHLIINVNGYAVQSNEQGSFYELIPLASGFHHIEFVVENRFGRSVKKTRDIVIQ